jgi:hypothetical protein
VSGVTPSGISNGDIVDVVNSLGHPGRSLTVESYGGPTTIRLNVCQIIHETQDPDNHWLTNAGFYTKPYINDEIEVQKENIVIESGAIWSLSDQVPLKDFKVVIIPNSAKITFM